MSKAWFGPYRGIVLKSRDGIPPPALPPRGINLANEARTARQRFYPVTLVYTTYALAVIAAGLRTNGRTAVLFIGVAAACWTLIEYLVHRHVLHRAFSNGPGRLRSILHHVFDPSHGDHHLRPWDGRHINGGVDTVPFAGGFALASFLAPLPTLPVFVAAILQCYVIEEWIHYAVHFHRFRGRYFEYIRKHHLYHHSARGRTAAFGLSSGIWDVPFRTRIPSKDRDVLYPRRDAGPRRTSAA